MIDFLAGVTGIRIISISNVSPIEIMRDNCILKLLKVSILDNSALGIKTTVDSAKNTGMQPVKIENSTSEVILDIPVANDSFRIKTDDATMDTQTIETENSVTKTQCPLCLKEYTKKGDCTKHMKKCHNSAMADKVNKAAFSIKCPVCREDFVGKRVLKHFSTEHRDALDFAVCFEMLSKQHAKLNS